MPYQVKWALPISRWVNSAGFRKHASVQNSDRLVVLTLCSVPIAVPGFLPGRFAVHCAVMDFSWKSCAGARSCA